MTSHLVALVAAGLFCGAARAEAQPPFPARLGTVKALKCVFTVLANGTWKNGEPSAQVKPAMLSMRFDAINTEEGTARVTDAFGHFEITARLSTDVLHFVQSFKEGPLYITTVFSAQSRDGKLKAVHTRHELTEAVLPGFTSSPEQYYGECEGDP
jgi:hypothetical protein